MKALIGLAVGIIFGYPSNISADTKIFAVILMAALDSILGGFCAKFESRFSDTVLITGFLINSVFGLILIFIGNIFEIELYYITLLVLGLRIFKNLSALKERLLKNYCG